MRVSATVTQLLVPLKDRALPNLPAVVQACAVDDAGVAGVGCVGGGNAGAFVKGVGGDQTGGEKGSRLEGLNRLLDGAGPSTGYETSLVHS